MRKCCKAIYKYNYLNLNYLKNEFFIHFQNN